MKFRRITAAALALMCLSCAACNDTGNGDAAQTTAASQNDDVKNGTFGDLKAVVESVKEYYDEGMEYIFMEDEYSDEVLMFTYGLMEDKFVNAVEDFVLSECSGMSADTFAIVKFKAGTDKALIDEAADVMKTEYIDGLKNKLAAYNPEEFAASDGYQVKIYDDAVMMVISSDNTADILEAAAK